VDIGGLPELRGIAVEDGALRLGAGTTVGELLADPSVRARLPALRAAAHDFADFLTRNKATLGGNLANASPGADLAVPLLALDAALVLAGPAGERTLALDAFLVGPRQTAVRAREAEARLVGAALAPPAVAAAAAEAAAAARPISDVRGSAEYRRAMVQA